MDGFFLPPSFPFLPSYYLTLPLFLSHSLFFFFFFVRYGLTLAQAGLLYFVSFHFEANYHAHLDAFLKVYICIQGMPLLSSTCKTGRKLEFSLIYMGMSGEPGPNRYVVRKEHVQIYTKVNVLN